MTTIHIGEQVFSLEVNTETYHLRCIEAALLADLKTRMRSLQLHKGPDRAQKIIATRENVNRIQAVLRIIRAVVELRRAILHLRKEPVTSELLDPLMTVAINNLQNQQE